MKRTLITIALTTLVVLILVAIASSSIYSFGGGAATQAPAEYRSFGTGGGGAPEVAPAPILAPVSDGYNALDVTKSQEAVSNIAAAEDQLVIQNANLEIVVKDPKARMKEISDLAKEFGGFVVSSNISQSFTTTGKEVPDANIVIRVPAERLDEALDKIKEGAVDVNFENRSGQDVTSQYVDLQSQLSAKQAAEKKLLEILDKADKTEDVLAVYVQLQQIQSEIEVLKGQIKYYKESAALSAVSVHLIAEETVQPVEIGGWKLPETANKAVRNLVLFTQGFVRLLITLVVYILPALILTAIPLYLVYRGGRALFRRFNKSSGRGGKMTVAQYLEKDNPENDK